MRLALAASVLWLAAGPSFAERDAPRHFVLISIDTLRADHVGAYGHDRPTTPAIDALAATGVRFETALAPSPWTKPSHASMFTGRYPSRHGATTMDAAIAEQVPTLAERLRAAGFRTSARVNATWLTSDGLERGFDDFGATPYIQGRADGSRMGDTALAWIEKTDFSRRQFLFLHWMDVHSDYVARRPYRDRFLRPAPGTDRSKGALANGTTRQLYEHLRGERTLRDADARRLSDLYDAGLRQVDDEIGRVVAALASRGRLDDTLIVLTSDHGEEFLEHGGVLHGYTQFDEVLHVPLIWRTPGVDARVVTAPVSLVDLAPTAYALLGVDPPAGMDGENLVPGWERPVAADAERLLFAEADTVFPPRKPGEATTGPWRALVSGSFKLYVHARSGRFRLFDRKKDPAERIDAARREPATTKKLVQAPACFLEAAPDRPPCPDRLASD